MTPTNHAPMTPDRLTEVADALSQLGIAALRLRDLGVPDQTATQFVRDVQDALDTAADPDAFNVEVAFDSLGFSAALNDLAVKLGAATLPVVFERLEVA